MSDSTGGDGAIRTLTLAESTGIGAVADLQVALLNLLDTDEATAVEVDCSAVRSIDAAVLQCLLMLSRAVTAGGSKRLRLVRASEDFRRIAAYAGLVDELVAA